MELYFQVFFLSQIGVIDTLQRWRYHGNRYSVQGTRVFGTRYLGIPV